MADPYAYPGTNVLRNRFDERDAGRLEQIEYRFADLRHRDAPTFPLTAQGYKDTHAHLLGDVYEWAGRTRTVDFSKGGSQFAFAAFLEAGLEGRFRELNQAGNLANLPGDRFAEQAAHHIAELNALHPFRDGNGRAMRLHLEQLATQAGHRLDQVRIPARDWLDASIASFNGHERPLARVIQAALEPSRRLSVGDAEKEVAGLQGMAREEIVARTRELHDRLSGGRDDRQLSQEIGELRRELAWITSPDKGPAGQLVALKAAGVAEITVLAPETASARDRVFAIGQAAYRLHLSRDQGREPGREPTVQPPGR